MSENTQVTEETILESLRQVMDPELNLDVVALGLIRGIDMDATPIHIKMILTTPFCPFAPWMVDQVRKAATAAAGAEVRVEMIAEQWHPELMEDPSLLGF